MLNSARKTLSFAAVLVSFAGLVGTASAQGTWAKDHPRRAEVNHRLTNQSKRIQHDVKNGTMTKAQAQTLHKDDQQVRQEERDMSSQDNGHITKQEQNTLNSQETAIKDQMPSH